MKTLVAMAIQHRKAILIGWGLFFGLAAFFAGRLPARIEGSSDTIPGSASMQTSEAIDAHFGPGTSFTLPILISHPSLHVGDPAFSAMAETIARNLMADQLVTRALHPWNAPEPSLMGKNQRSVLLLVTPVASSYAATEKQIGRLQTAVAKATKHTGFSATVGGTPAVYHEMNMGASKDFLRAEQWGIPLTMLILLVVFRSPMAALLPLLLSMIAVVGAMAALYLLSFALSVGVFAENIVSLIGLGVGVDYALFTISRFRKSLGKGLPIAAAVNAALMEAGKAVFFSGITVVIGFLALFLTHAPFLHTIALGGVVVVTIAVAATLTLLPALLLLMGTRVNWPFGKRNVAVMDKPTLLGRWTRWVTTRPIGFAVVGLLLLAILMAPIGKMSLWNIGADDLRPASSLKQGARIIDQQFAKGWMGPVAILVTSNQPGGMRDPKAVTAFGQLGKRFMADPRAAAVLGFPAFLQAMSPTDGASPAEQAQQAVLLQTMFSVDGQAGLLTIVPNQGPEEKAVIEWVRALRKETFDELKPLGLRVQVGGVTAMVSDFDQEMIEGLYRVIPAVLLITFVSLILIFRSVLIPFKAMLLNLMSVLASYGFLVAVFQYGLGSEWLGFSPPGGLSSFIVLMLFPILFGLSMDYEIFLLSSIHDHHRQGLDNRAAVAAGMMDTAGIITSAALIMVCLFGSFWLTSMVPTRQFGLGLAFAILIDATVIRVVLIPSLMVLLGRVNWWAPQFLR